MATGPTTRVSDVVVPSIFTPYTQQLTAEKARLVQSGVIARDAELDNLLAGGGKTFNVPSFKDLDNEDERVSTDTPHAEFTGGTAEPDPKKIQTATEIAVRLSRNQSWSSTDLTGALAGADPMAAIANRVGYYWARRLQKAFVATLTGVFADNAAADSNDYTVNISGSSYVPGTTDFSAEAFIDAATTLGDSADEVTGVMVHSVVYARMQKNNLIDFIPDSNGVVNIPTFLGRAVVVDDGMPVSSGVYESWLFGPGIVRWGVGTPKVPTEIERKAGAGNGAGQEILYNRVEWTLHPVGHAFVASSIADGGPSNASTANNLANASSWDRRFAERKMIKLARLITREA